MLIKYIFKTNSFKAACFDITTAKEIRSRIIYWAKYRKDPQSKDKKTEKPEKEI